MPGGVPSRSRERPVADLHRARRRRPASGTSTATSTSTSTTASASCASATRTRSIAAAVKARMDRGTHFAAPTEGSITVAEELRRRWGLPHWRFTNSGTESTMDAVHLARGLTGRDVIIKIEGSYHGHHDAVMVSVKPPPEEMGDRDHPNAIPYGLGYAGAAPRRARGPCRSTTPRRSSALLDRARGPGRRADPRAGDDEHQHRRARSTATSSACASSRRARHPADLRRGQDRRRDRRRRRDRAVRRHARHGLPRQGDLRRPPRRRDRHERRGRRAGRVRRRAPAGHLQRQPARDGGRRRRRCSRSSRPTPTRTCTGSTSA